MSKLRNFFIAIIFAGAANAAEPALFDILDHGAIGDGTTLNTKAIQSTIDLCASGGGGIVVVPKGEFVSGSLFLKPGVNLELRDGAVLKGSSNIEDYDLRNTRFEGHF